MVRDAFAALRSERLRGFVVWVPMLAEDTPAAAEAEAFADPRVARGWDATREIADGFAASLRLRRTAWDVYLIYAPGITWRDDEPPAPSAWMHQLGPDVPAPVLDAARFQAMIGGLLEGPR